MNNIEYRRACQHTRMASTSVGVVFMPTALMISSLHSKMEPVIMNTGQAVEVVDEVLNDYEILFNNPAEFVAKYPGNYPEQTLDIMDAFTSITPLSSKVSEMVSLCTCADAYQKYTCVEAIILSMIFNPNLSVPDTDRAKQLNSRKCDKPANQFNMKRVKELKTEQAALEASEAPNRKPKVCGVFERARAGSAVELAMHCSMQRLSGATGSLVNRVAAQPL
jgi:hypothetical protein